MLYLAKITEAEQDYVKVQFEDNPSSVNELKIKVINTLIGSGNEGIEAPLGKDDIVVVAFTSLEPPIPFILGKVKPDKDRLNFKGCRLGDKEVEFKDSTITIRNKDNTQLKIKINANDIELERDVPFNDIEFGSQKFFEFILGMKMQGNMGFPCPLSSEDGIKVNEMKTATKIKIGI